MKNQKLEKVISIISNLINRPVKEINLDSKAKDFERWDSLAHIRIILEIEKLAKKKIPTTEISKLDSVKAIMGFLEK